MRWITASTLLALSFVAGCTGICQRPAPAVTTAVCVLRGTAGNEQVSGVVTFTQMDGYVLVEAEMAGLSPGRHGFHVHHLGDISGAGGKTTGGHFNPGALDHGSPEDRVRHVGDLGNIVADADGIGRYRRRDTVISLDPSDPACVVGRAIIVHADEDDLTSQPTGAAGARVASGVIGIGSD